MSLDRSIRAWLWVSLTLLMVPLSAQAVTRWVAQSGGTTGTCATAVGATDPGTYIRTVVAGGACMSGGDTLKIMPGTYTENFTSCSTPFGAWGCWPSGSAGAPTLVQAVTPLSVTLRNSTSGSQRWLIYLENRHDITFDGLRLNGGGPTPTSYVLFDLNLNTSNIIFQNGEMTCVDGGGFGFVQGGDQTSLIKNTVMHDNDPAGVDVEGTSHAVYGNPRLEGNTVYNISGYGFHIHREVDHPPNMNPYAINNTIHDTRQGACIVCNNCGGTAFFANNILYNCSGPGIQIYECNGGAFEIYNNTIYSNGRSGVEFNHTPNACGENPTVTVRNNIAYNNAAGGLQDLSCPGSPGCPAGGQSRFITAPNAADHNLCNAMGGGCTLTGPPGFVSVAGGNEDFRLATAGSPAVNAGVNLTSAGITTDADGVARPSGSAPWELGAYEFGVTEPPQPDPVNLLGYWPLDTGSGTSAFEAGGHTGTLDSAAWQSPGIIGPSSFAPTGTQEILVSNVTGFNTPQSCSLVAWINMTEVDTSGCAPVSDREGCAMYLSPTGAPECWIYGGPGLTIGALGTVSILDTGPRMISCTYDAAESGASIRTYVDTAQVAIQATTTPMFFGAPAGAFTIGRDGINFGGYQCRGVIDEVRRYQGRLSAQAIQNLFSQFVAPAGLSLVHTRWTAAHTAEGSFLSPVDSDLALPSGTSVVTGLRSALHNATGGPLTEYFRTYCRVFTTAWGAWTEVTQSFGSLGLRYLNPDTAVNLGSPTTPLLPLDGFTGVPGKFIADVVNLTSPPAAQQMTIGQGEHAEQEVRLELGAPLVANNQVQCKVRRQSGADLDSYGGAGDPLVKTLTLVPTAPVAGVRAGGASHGESWR